MRCALSDLNTTRALRFGIGQSPPRRWFDAVPAHTVVMALLFGSAIVIAAYLLPGDGERIAMLERDGKTREARGILEASFAAGDRRQRSLFQLQGLYEATGDIDRARAMLEELAALRPRDFAVQRQLAQFYKNVQDEPAYVRALLNLIDLRYSETACRDVAGILRRRGEYGQEQAALTKCRLKGYRRADDMIRLALLNAADGDAREAAALLKAVDDLRRLKSDREHLQLFQLLIEIEQPREAQRRAVRWVKANRDDEMALAFIRGLSAINRHDLGIELAKEVSVPGDAVFLAIPELLADQSIPKAAQDLLRGWLEKAPVFDEVLGARFITAALDVGAPELAYRGAERLGLPLLNRDLAINLVRSLEEASLDAQASRIRQEMQLGARAISKAAATNADKLRRFGKNQSQANSQARPERLAVWRADLWKRLQKDNRSASTTQAEALKKIKRAKRVQSATRRFNGKATPPTLVAQPNPEFP